MIQRQLVYDLRSLGVRLERRSLARNTDFAAATFGPVSVEWHLQRPRLGKKKQRPKLLWYRNGRTEPLSYHLHNRERGASLSLSVLRCRI